MQYVVVQKYNFRLKNSTARYFKTKKAPIIIARSKTVSINVMVIGKNNKLRQI